MNTENSKTYESNKFFYKLTNNLILKTQIKTLHWLIKVFIAHGKTLNLHITRINLKFLLQLGMMNLIYLMDHILFQIFKIILSTLLKK